MVCYFTLTGAEPETVGFAEVVAECVSGPLTIVTLVPKPTMRGPQSTVEIWGAARAEKAFAPP
jgi:hypothetical protein